MDTGDAMVGGLAVWGTGIAILVLLMLSAFFSGSETALTASNRGKLRSMADRGEGGAETALKLTEDSERLIGSVLLGNNIVNILSAALATSLFTRLMGDSGVAVATVVMTALVLVFSEVMPKTYAITNPERASRMVAQPVQVVVLALSPVVTLVRALVNWMLGAVGVETDPSAHVLSARDELAGAIALHHSEGAVEKADRDRLLGALDLGEREVEEIMLHRQSIEMIDVDTPPAAILEQALGSPYTRLPIYRDDQENIVGVLHAKDLLRAVHKLLTSGGALDSFDVMQVAMKPYFVPETTTLDDQMREFLRRRSHFALVVDEYGALSGLITLEDILEEIVGEIADEHDTAGTTVKRERDGTVTVDGSMTIRDLNRACEWALPDTEANTIAGLVIHEAQTIPTAGQVFSFHGFRIEVLEREKNRLTRLRLRKLG